MLLVSIQTSGLAQTFMSNKTLLVVALIIGVIAALFVFNQPSYELSGTDGSIQGQPDSIPQYSYTDILNNDEFKLGMQQAVENNDVELAKELQQKALEIAHAANLPESEINLLSGENGLRFMGFLASRQLFVEKFQQHYLSFKDIEQLKLDYPEAYDLFERSDKLIELRDDQIQQLAEALAGESGDVDLHIHEAKEQWKTRLNSIE
ncbi:hypothetical protein GLIP_1534 [Aliiglaciecola lipolytica E3]|uniref:Uncharacterized protein n=2 Tax=Aliiglaciecola TaxID=1406885 RepID=K6YBZ3_9ALTE|nr:hypothetical protein GLIP_1534 [Aliiglaciecola lipolytica E3]